MFVRQGFQSACQRLAKMSSMSKMLGSQSSESSNPLMSGVQSAVPSTSVTFLLYRPTHTTAASVFTSTTPNIFSKETSTAALVRDIPTLHSSRQSLRPSLVTAQEAPKKRTAGVRTVLQRVEKDFLRPKRGPACVKRYSTDCHVVTSQLKDIDIPDCNLCEFTWHGIDNWAEKTAVVCGVSGRSYTYSQLRRACSSFASSLRTAGFQPGQVLAIILPNTPDYPVAMLGAIEAGLIVTTVNPFYVPAEIATQLLDADARVVLTQPEMLGNVQQATCLAAEKGYRKPMIIVTHILEMMQELPEGIGNMQSMIDECVDTSGNTPNYPVTRDTPAIIPYSSGTTGLPKGVLLSHRNIIANSLQMQDDAIAISQPTCGDYQDCFPAVLPFYHLYGMVVILLTKLRLGSKIVTLPKFETSSFLNAVHGHKATVLYLVPPLILALGSNPDATREHFKSVRYVLSAAAPLGSADLQRFIEKVPPTVKCLQAYGLTETSPILFHPVVESNKVTGVPPVAISSKLSSVGRCVPNTSAKIIDSSGEALRHGEVGEVCVKGPQIMVGYHKNTQATAEMISEDGWLRTGDLGYYDEDKDFYIVDRLKELIKVNGLQVAPAQLEEILRSHPGVLDAAVIGIPHERYGEVPRGYVVTKRDNNNNLEEDLRKFVEAKVSKFKYLEGGIRIVKSIPKSPSGKILRKILRDEFKKEKDENKK